MSAYNVPAFLLGIGNVAGDKQRSMPSWTYILVEGADGK